jgi:hypothetical protein
MAARLSAPRAGQPLPPGIFLVLISVRGWDSALSRSQGHREAERTGQLKNPMTSSGIKPATFRLAAQCLNQLHYHMPLCMMRRFIICTYRWEDNIKMNVGYESVEWIHLLWTGLLCMQQWTSGCIKGREFIEHLGNYSKHCNTGWVNYVLQSAVL